MRIFDITRRALAHVFQLRGGTQVFLPVLSGFGLKICRIRLGVRFLRGYFSIFSGVYFVVHVISLGTIGLSVHVFTHSNNGDCGRTAIRSPAAGLDGFWGYAGKYQAPDFIADASSRAVMSTIGTTRS